MNHQVEHDVDVQATRSEDTETMDLEEEGQANGFGEGEDGLIVSAFDHATSENLVDGGVVVQLCPYATTPNEGGEYKAWLTPVEDYDPTAQNAVHGFLHHRSKTDNFKVQDEVPPPPPPDGGDGDGQPFTGIRSAAELKIR